MDMTIEQFKAWAATATFTTTEHIDGETGTQKLTGWTDDGDEILADVAYACACKTMEAKLPDGTRAEITYQQAIEWPGTEKARIKDEYEASDPETVDTFMLEGLRLVDEDGDTVDRTERDEVLEEAVTGITNIDYESLLPHVITEDIDIKDTDMDIIEIPRDNEPTLRFTGELIASASSSSDRARSDFSGSTGRWTVLKLYKTKGGKFVAQQIGRTQWQGEHTRYSAKVCDTPAQVIEFLGHGWLAKELYEEADIEDVQDVE